MGSVFLDVRYAFRVLRKNAAFSAFAILSLTLGIGPSVAVFTVINALLLKPLPYKNANRLGMAWAVNQQYGVKDVTVTFGEFDAWREQNTTFDQMSVFAVDRFTVNDFEGPNVVEGIRCPQSLFEVLGVKLLAGRIFSADEEKRGALVAVIGESLWRSRFGGDSALVGRSIRIDGRPYVVIGILPTKSQFPRKGELGGHYISDGAELWLPPDISPAGVEASASVNKFFVVGRLKPDSTFKAAEAELSSISTRISSEHSNIPSKLGVYVVSLLEQTVGKTSAILFALQGAMGCLLLIACANVANLILARTTVRRGEFAIRQAIGAGRSRLFRQILAETSLLVLFGGIAGVFLAQLTIHVLTAFRPENLPRWDEVRLNSNVLFFVMGIVIASGLLLGFAVLFQASQSNIADALRSPDKAPNRPKMLGRTGQLFVLVEIAASFMLVASGGLMAQSLRNLLDGDLGFQKDKLILFDIAAPNPKYSEDWKKAELFAALLNRLRQMPGVKAVAAAHVAPLRGQHAAPVFIEDQPLPAGTTPPFASFRFVSDHYFETVGISLLRGNQFSRPSKPTGVNSAAEAIINEMFARKFFGNVNPIGKRVKIGSGNWLTVIGVIGDFKNIALESDPVAEIYFQSLVSPLGEMTFAIRTETEPSNYAAAIRQCVAEIDDEQPITHLQTMRQIVDGAAASRRFSTMLVSLTAALGLGLAALGIYAVISFSAKQRIREIGIRIALGATPTDVRRLIMRTGSILIALGTVTGLAGTLILSPVMRSFVFGISAVDPFTMVGVTFLLEAVS